MVTALGASLQEVLQIIKADKVQYPAIDLHFSQTEPLATPVIVALPGNGIRLQFDGADQRLRLIEIMDFSLIRLTYKGSELVKAHDDSSASGPAYKRIYQIIGASYPGEYMAPKSTSRDAIGTYITSWPGVACTWPLPHGRWSAGKDHAALLDSYAGPATHMALFEGRSWQEARTSLFTRQPAAPRISALAMDPRDMLPTEVEYALVRGNGEVTLVRRTPAPPFEIILNETTPQDLVTELGPPDATHKREDPVPDQLSHRRTGSASRPLTAGRAHVGSLPSSYSSTGTDTFDSDFDSGDADEDPSERASRERFWCFFSHGMDILVGPPVNAGAGDRNRTPMSASPHLVVTKVILHGNVPGSYAFNRHRRLRWSLELESLPSDPPLNSESHFETDIKPVLMETFARSCPESEMGRGKVVNRTWGGSPSDSTFFIPSGGDGEGEDLIESGGNEQWLGNTRLYAFPGLVFEVLENGTVGGLTVY